MAKSDLKLVTPTTVIEQLPPATPKPGSAHRRTPDRGGVRTAPANC